MGILAYLTILVRKIDLKRFFWPGLAVFTVLIWAAIFSFPRDNRLLLKFYDVGEGDAIFIRTEQGKKVLIDGGPDARVVNYLSKELPFYDRTLDLIIVTHPHADHLRGLVEVLTRYRVRRVIYNPGQFPEAVYHDFEKEVKAQNIPIWTAKAGDTVNLDAKSRLLVLWPTSINQETNNPNETSIILLLRTGNFSALLLDDAEKSVQEGLILPPGDNDLEVLKVPHHGARTALDEPLVGKASPRIAVISVGRNSYGHPAAEVLGAYSIRNIPILRTDESGSVSILTDGHKWEYETAR